MAIADDFVIDPENRLIRHQSGSTVYTTNNLYSYLHDYFDEIMAMSYPVAMSAQTPSEYSLINGWYLTEDSHKFINGGAIKTIGQDAAIYNAGIYILKFDSVGYTNCEPTDVGLNVAGTSSMGTLLDYDNALRKWWVRRDIGTSWSGDVTITNGIGAGTITSVATGESLYANIFTLGELESTLTNSLYIEQVNLELTDDSITQFWPDEHIDILVKVKEANTFIDNGIIRVYVREFHNLSTHYKADLSTGGRQPIPLSTLADSNNLTSAATVQTWTDVQLTFGSTTNDIGDGVSAPYDVEIDCGNRASLREVYEYLKYITNRTYTAFINNKSGRFYRSAVEGYRENLQSPFGSFTGGRFYGARGVWIKNPPYIDLNNYQLLDSNNNLRQPKYTSIGTLKFDVNLTDVGANAVYRLFYKQISTSEGSRIYGTESGVMVNKDDNITPVSGSITSNQVLFDYDYDGNTQTSWLPNHSYVIDDEFRYEYEWYRVTVNFSSSGTFGATELANTQLIDGPSVVLVALGLDKAQHVSAEGVITRSTENLIAVDAPPELNYIT